MTVFDLDEHAACPPCDRCAGGGILNEAGSKDWTAARREAWVDSETADLRYKRDVAEGVRQAALEAVRARRTQVSVLQSLLNADRAEAEFARTGPN